MSLYKWALLGALEGLYIVPAHLMGYLDRAFAEAGDILEAVEQQFRDRLAGLLETELPAEELQGYIATGARWTEAQAATAADEQIVARERPPGE